MDSFEFGQRAGPRKPLRQPVDCGFRQNKWRTVERDKSYAEINKNGYDQRDIVPFGQARLDLVLAPHSGGGGPVIRRLPPGAASRPSQEVQSGSAQPIEGLTHGAGLHEVLDLGNLNFRRGVDGSDYASQRHFKLCVGTTEMRGAVHKVGLASPLFQFIPDAAKLRAAPQFSETNGDAIEPVVEILQGRPASERLARAGPLSPQPGEAHLEVCDSFVDFLDLPQDLLPRPGEPLFVSFPQAPSGPVSRPAVGARLTLDLFLIGQHRGALSQVIENFAQLGEVDQASREAILNIVDREFRRSPGDVAG